MLISMNILSSDLSKILMWWSVGRFLDKEYLGYPLSSAPCPKIFTYSSKLFLLTLIGFFCTTSYEECSRVRIESQDIAAKELIETWMRSLKIWAKKTKRLRALFKFGISRWMKTDTRHTPAFLLLLSDQKILFVTSCLHMQWSESHSLPGWLLQTFKACPFYR